VWGGVGACPEHRNDISCYIMDRVFLVWLSGCCCLKIGSDTWPEVVSNKVYGDFSLFQLRLVELINYSPAIHFKGGLINLFIYSLSN
jgi:hypothetical protein